MEIATLPQAVEPTDWFVLFHRKPGPSRFLNLLAGRGFKHVSAIGYYPGFRAWLVCDAQWEGLRLQLCSHESMLRQFAAYSADCAIVKFPRRHTAMPVHSRLGFYCVPAIKHLLGIGGGALRPQGLYRQLLRHGGTLIDATKRADNTDRP